MYNSFTSILLILSLLSCTQQEAPLYREVKLLQYSETSLYRSLDQFPEEVSAKLQEKLWTVTAKEPPGFYYDSITGSISYTHYTDFSSEDQSAYFQSKDLESIIRVHKVRNSIRSLGDSSQFESTKKKISCQGEDYTYLDNKQNLKVLVEKDNDSLTYGLRISFLKKSNNKWVLYDHFRIPNEQTDYAVQCVATAHTAENGSIIYIETAYEWMNNKWTQEILLLPSKKLAISDLK
ncbi:hypothetical protein AMR72_15140 [Flavobacterium psychrophilum]|nr:hypothetical protein AMR72_15140 [Flavobacterium psychrophilum]AOE53734.1 hypothetical protein ALW18_15130 [Flavobacterium psychrophilum]